MNAARPEMSVTAGELPAYPAYQIPWGRSSGFRFCFATAHEIPPRLNARQDQYTWHHPFQRPRSCVFGSEPKYGINHSKNQTALQNHSKYGIIPHSKTTRTTLLRHTIFQPKSCCSKGSRRGAEWSGVQGVPHAWLSFAKSRKRVDSRTSRS